MKPCPETTPAWVRFARQVRAAPQLADVITMAERVDRLDHAVSEMAALFRDDSEARDEKFLEHDRWIQKLENYIEFAERFGGQGRLEPLG